MSENPLTIPIAQCSNCIFWVGNEERYSVAIDAARCKYAINTEDATEWNDESDRVLKREFEQTKAFVADGSGYFAAFYTKADFCCNAHQQQQAEEKRE